jgi:phosphoribosylformylglycinamidine cyclo-ligase
MAHITGGGLPGNLPRILPMDLQVELETAAWPLPAIFTLISELGPVSRKEMFRTFNMGIGYCLIIPDEQAGGMIDYFTGKDIPAFRIGRVAGGQEKVVIKDL